MEVFVKIFLFLGFAVFGATDLPYFMPEDFTPYWQDEVSEKIKPLEISSFSLMDQNKQKITDKNFQKHITVMNFFFASCEGICPMMMKTLQSVNKKIHEQLPNQQKFQLVSFTVTPQLDTPEKLQAFMEKRKLDTENWHLLTGSPGTLQKLAKKFRANLDVLSRQKDEFVHSEAAYLFDQKGRVRGIYNTKSRADMDLLIKDAKFLAQ